MFEKFTDGARRVIVLAQEEARTLSHAYIGTEHLLLGLIREGDGVAATALASLGISLDAARHQVHKIIGRGQQASSGHIPFTPRAKKVMQLAALEAKQLGHDDIGSEHLLLGLIREGEGVAVQVLVTLGVDLKETHRRVILLCGSGGSAVAMSRPEATTSAKHRSQDQVLACITGLDARLSAMEQRVGAGADTSELDEQIERVRENKEVAVRAQEYERAASLRDREKDLLVQKAAREQEWAAMHPSLPALAELCQQLHDELERLRELLRRHGIDPKHNTA